MTPIRVAIVGVGNCASSLIQGIHYYRDKSPETAVGLMHWRIGEYGPSDLEIVSAFDIDARKVGRDVNEAIFALPNCTTVFCGGLPTSGVKVRIGSCSRWLLGTPRGLSGPSDVRSGRTRAEADRADVVAALRASRAEVMLNYLPVGSEEAVRFYAECALEAGLALVNCMPVFIASDPVWAQRYRDAGLPIIGDDIKAQLGATITHRMLTDLFHKRGVRLERTYQLNTGGNTDFLNMLNRSRLRSKKTSKTEGANPSPKNASMTTTSTSARATTCRGRRTTKSVPADGREVVRRRADESGIAARRSRIRRIPPASQSTWSAARNLRSNGARAVSSMVRPRISANTRRASTPTIRPIR